MVQCPVCYTDNVTGAVECRDCKKPLKATSPMCRNGHVMDPSWTECMQCRSEGRLPPRNASPHPPTRIDQAAVGFGSRETRWDPPAPPAPPAPGPITPARQGFSSPPPKAVAPESSSRKTSFAIPRDLPEPDTRRPAQKMIAVLVTYTWQPEGQIFPVREGRNRIGSDPGQCDIAVPKDDTLSSIHSSISFRTKFVISDLDSMSGTYVNDRAVEEQSYPLENYAQIRTGSTVWTFVILHSATSDAEPGK